MDDRRRMSPRATVNVRNIQAVSNDFPQATAGEPRAEIDYQRSRHAMVP